MAGGPPMRAVGPVQRRAPPPSRKPSVFLLLLGLAGLGVGGYALFYGFARTSIDEEAVLHGSIIGGLGLLFFCLWLRKAVHPAAAAAAFLAVIGAAAGFGYFAVGNARVEAAENTAQEQLYASISTVCTINEGLPDAIGYQQGTAQTAMFYNRGSDGGEWYPSRYGVSEQYRPSDSGALNIVVCVETTTRFIESCPYSTTQGDRTLSREQYVKTITVRDARTAEVLEAHTLEGSIPSECPSSRTFGEYEYTASSYGTLPSGALMIEQINDWLIGSAIPGPRANGSGNSGFVPVPGGGAQAPNGTAQPPAQPPSGGPAVGVKPGDEPSNGKP